MANVFISYNRESEAITKNLVDDIKLLGHTAWFDQELSGGQVWWDQILEEIRNNDVFVFVLSPESLSSTACKLEYRYAAELRKTILPVLIAEGISTNLLPPALLQIQFVDYLKRDRNAAFRLAKALATVPLSPSLPSPLPSQPEVPVSYLGSFIELIEATSTLSYEKQSALVVDLKISFRDQITTNDARILLEKLRHRRDLFATIAEEIDELLGSTIQAPSPSFIVSEREFPSSDALSPKTPTLEQSSETQKDTQISRDTLQKNNSHLDLVTIKTKKANSSEQIKKQTINDSTSLKEIILVSCWLIGTAAISFLFFLFFNDIGLVCGLLIGLLSEFWILYKRWQLLTGKHVAIYWLGGSTIILLLSVLLFQINSIYIFWGRVQGLTFGVFMNLCIEAWVVYTRWPDLTRAEFIIYWLGSTFLSIFFLGNHYNWSVIPYSLFLLVGLGLGGSIYLRRL